MSISEVLIDIELTSVPSEKKGMILFHWDSVDKSQCVAALERLEKAIVEWS